MPAWFLVPVPREKVQKALIEAYPKTFFSKTPSLLDLSAIPGFPKDLFERGMHPVMTVGGLSADIRLNALQISGPLLTASSVVPFVSYDGGKKPMVASLNGYIGGEDEDSLIDRLNIPGLLPALVSSLVGGIYLRLGNFLPKDMAYQCTNGEFFEQSKWVIVANRFSGPGIYIEAVDMAFRSTTNPRYSMEFWESVINQPIILQGLRTGDCQRNAFFFNESTAGVQFRSGEVTLGPSSSGLGIRTTTLQGKYTGLHGISACAQNVGFAAQKCKDFE